MPHLPQGSSSYDFHRHSLSSINELVSNRNGYRSVDTTPIIPDRNTPLLSPAISELSIEEHSNIINVQSHRQTYLDLIGKRDTYFTPTDDEMKNSANTPVSPMENKTRAQYFEEQFQYKDNTSAIRDRIQSESPVVAELRTNVIVKDEYTLVTDMSSQLSTRYARSESSLMINVDHSACLLLAGSFEPAYILTIHALPSQLQPTTNKRNAALIQAFMADVLSVPPERGIIRFQPIAQENLATNGTTMLGAIERLEKAQVEEGASTNGISRAFSRAALRKSMANKRSVNMSLFPDRQISNAPPTTNLPSPLNPDPITTSPQVDEHSLLSAPLEALPPMPSPSRSPPPAPGVFELPADNEPRPYTSDGVPSGAKDSKRNSLRSGVIPNFSTATTVNGGGGGIDWRPQTPSKDYRERDTARTPSTKRSKSSHEARDKGVREIVSNEQGNDYPTMTANGVTNGNDLATKGPSNGNTNGFAISVQKGVPPPPPPVPESKTIKLGKRKSFLAVFRR